MGLQRDDNEEEKLTAGRRVSSDGVYYNIERKSGEVVNRVELGGAYTNLDGATQGVINAYARELADKTRENGLLPKNRVSQFELAVRKAIAETFDISKLEQLALQRAPDTTGKEGKVTEAPHASASIA